ncbi:hypothetical protein NHP21005_02640 [Helicobacter sp. NHP21005]|uniref:hypothetical protein n=1 Tax=Helicobacter felistomachi TaxID=3040201 RepID=UPI002574886D|nr:hypothetical protein [Helicobacter sp. NHP21005]BEG56576.1 hypothetical protein NHP21005_02640 [Helicobacter sp. NHP21005]
MESALNEDIGMSGLDQKLHEILMPLRFDLEDLAGFNASSRKARQEVAGCTS